MNDDMTITDHTMTGVMVYRVYEHDEIVPKIMLLDESMDAVSEVPYRSRKWLMVWRYHLAKKESNERRN